MKHHNWVFMDTAMATAALMLLLPWKSNKYGTLKAETNKSTALFAPSDHFFLQRSWPDRKPDFRGYEQAIKQAASTVQRSSFNLPGFGNNWTLEGPGNIGGRINTVLVHPLNHDTIFAGCASGPHLKFL